MANIPEITTEHFENEVLKSPIPVLIDFHALWCGPCKAMMPTLEHLAREYDGEVKVVKVDIDSAAEIAARYEVRGVPTFVFVKNGEAKERIVGSTTRGKLAALAERYTGESE